MENCPICETTLQEQPIQADNFNRYDCPNCGIFALGTMARFNLPGLMGSDPQFAQNLSHAIWKMHRNYSIPSIDKNALNNLADALRSPPALQEQADNLMLELSAATRTPGQAVPILNSSHWAARVGASDAHSVRFIAESLIDRSLLQDVPVDAGRAYRITFSGWQYIDELQRGRRESRKAFFASKWGDDQLDCVFNDILVPAVQQTGFRLFRLDHEPKAGLIDDRMRVEIRTSRFAIADLTHDNSGAYWEAGYAEGLGKPVIFICEKAAFEEHDTHFDTNHHLTVVWDEGDPEGTAERLKATIRATLPEDAILQDDDTNSD